MIFAKILAVLAATGFFLFIIWRGSWNSMGFEFQLGLTILLAISALLAIGELVADIVKQRDIVDEVKHELEKLRRG